MSEPTEKVTNWNLLNWCIVVAVELVILAALIPFPLIILLGVVLINPVRAALDWHEPSPDAPAQGPGGAARS